MQCDEQSVSSKVSLTNKSLLPLFSEKSGGSQKIVSTQPGMGNFDQSIVRAKLSAACEHIA